MERKLAEQVVNEFEKKNGPTLSVLEAMSMTKVMTDGYEMYAIQKGDVTFLVWKIDDGKVVCKTQCW